VIWSYLELEWGERSYLQLARKPGAALVAGFGLKRLEEVWLGGIWLGRKEGSATLSVATESFCVLSCR